MLALRTVGEGPGLIVVVLGHGRVVVAVVVVVDVSVVVDVCVDVIVEGGMT
jgi:hypothetical protein